MDLTRVDEHVLVLFALRGRFLWQLCSFVERFIDSRRVRNVGLVLSDRARLEFGNLGNNVTVIVSMR